MKGFKGLYPFHNANIHERRFAARFFRAVPLVSFIVVVLLVVYAVIWDHYVLLALSATMNVCLWLWIVTTCLIGIVGSVLVDNELQAYDQLKRRSQGGEYGATVTGGDMTATDSVVHLIVLPNYKEEEAMLSQTLASLAEAKDAQSFRVVLAMEEREGGGVAKAERLQSRWQGSFEQLTQTHHPGNLTQLHNDNTVDDEVPGKASNVKWAVKQGYDWLQKEGVLTSNVILTVADADCMFHPEYFASITKDFNAMREAPGSEQKWSMWQAPQLSFRDHWRAIICARSWTYVSGMYEFGGVSGLFLGGHHMVFSGYSLTLDLAINASCWDGDIIAEDHHAYIKNFFYSAYESARMALEDSSRSCKPRLQVRPVYLPVKSTPVMSEDSYWQNYVDRWNQAKRHAQGIAEVSYALLAAWDALSVLPIRLWTLRLFTGIGKVLVRLLCMHILPIAQSAALGALTLYWLWNGRNVPMCPDYLTFAYLERSEYMLCGLAGAWVLTWPVVVPMLLLIICNCCFVYVAFLKPARVQGDDTHWRKEDGDFPQYNIFCGSQTVAAFALIAADCVFGLFLMMIPYGLLVVLLASWNTCFKGNRFKYVTAAKPTKAQGPIAIV